MDSVLSIVACLFSLIAPHPFLSCLLYPHTPHSTRFPYPFTPPPPHLLVARGLQFSPFLIPSHPTSPHSSTRSHITFVCTLRAAYTAEFWKKYLFFYFLKAFWVLNQHDWSIFCIILVSLLVWMVDVSPFACNLLVVGTVLLPFSQEHWKH